MKGGGGGAQQGYTSVCCAEAAVWLSIHSGQQVGWGREVSTCPLWGSLESTQVGQAGGQTL